MIQPEKEKNDNIFWGFFASLKLTFTLLIVLALVSIAGTLIPQGQESIAFTRELSPAAFRFFDLLGLFDMYHSLWFRILLAALTMNLIVCSIDRFQVTWKRFKADPGPERSKPFENIPPDQTFAVQNSFSETSGMVINLFGSRFKNFRSSESDGRISLLGNKGRYSYFGVYLVHLSVLLILGGALFGSFTGFEGFVNIAEGEKTGKIAVKKRAVPMDLGFEVLCEKFFLEFYENGAPKEYRSDLKFIVDGKEVKSASARVNHPVEFNGITFYQSSYGTIPGKNVRIKISRNTSEKMESIIDAETGRPMELPGKEGRFQLLDIHGNLKGVMGPAVLISIEPENGKEVRFWIFKHPERLKERFPPQMLTAQILNPSAFQPYTFFLEDLNMRYYTGLQVNRDPGVLIVWTGFFLMTLGFILTFFHSHRRVWVRVSEEKDGVRVSVAGTANKNQVGLDRYLIKLAEELKNMFNKER